ncbi:MocR-like pyridoxine biosynthesis transcription factor PdxR [Burkholderia pseudomallei]|uniref:MocR-like pyridoxine biosynthesis transcription factor PdxR n=1 Tax=Burkholderia pseudomallei TaxID=28450 RepID=UPI000F05F16D|nr:PLP-dependent aminotransferase family protein [Burkholderia pseudomallei]MBF3873758.1 PLP-dependent aminotransferase family protein [Burkholderia pseudomallei]MCW0012565.1 PLP-dependent aminotransferase family protein [Burkholderia pseudomallei]MCW0031657.1 PLP-dependent aminotransferase family protein [Burkholderia pseudomallei]MCW0052141.1 PLP-dependent aminotransferase family protein [Burkholderia pseudomallei]MCW0064763.1 PLP-dependent aminotransferase family protein [Burkholderia pseud
MDLQISLRDRRDLAGQIYRQLRAAIVDGRLAAGARLPSTRELARQLGVSRKTTLDAFERLASEGFLLARTGNGTFVAGGLTRVPGAREPAANGSGTRAQAPRADGRDAALARAHAGWSDVPAGLSMPPPHAPLAFDFRGGVTDKMHFPWDDWRRSIQHALRAQARSSGDYRDPAGEPELRDAIARYVGFSRAVACDWRDVIVTQGAQQALDLLARVLVRPGDIVAVEEPGYPPARAAFAALGACVIGVPVDAHGLVVAQLPDDARFVYVTPSHQFPLGMPMSLERRVALLEWAQRRRAVIVEDDYDCEFRFEGRPLEPLKSLDRAGLVAYVGTFSKTLFPELRIGYAVPPRSLNLALRKAKQIVDWHACTLTQTALARFIADGAFARHLRRIHRRYDARRRLLAAHLHGALSHWLRPVIPAAGIHLTARFATGIDERAALDAARDADIDLHGISAFYADSPAESGILFGYGGIDAPAIDVALTRLAGVLKRCA